MRIWSSVVGKAHPVGLRARAINRDLFDSYVQTQVTPMLRKGDGVILDTFCSHKQLEKPGSSPPASRLVGKARRWRTDLLWQLRASIGLRDALAHGIRKKRHQRGKP